MKLRGPYSSDYPAQERALELVDLLKRGERIDADEADRCYLVYGFPELEPGAVALALAEISMRPQNTPTDTTVAKREGDKAPHTIIEPTYGFTRRASGPSTKKED